MPTTRQDIREWFDRGKKVHGNKVTHMIVTTDTFSWEDYPVYVLEGQDVHERVSYYNRASECRSVMEVYSYKIDFDKQLAEHRSYNY